MVYGREINQTCLIIILNYAIVIDQNERKIADYFEQ